MGTTFGDTRLLPRAIALALHLVSLLILAFNILIGLIAIFVLFGHIRVGSIHRDANSWPSADPNQSTSPAN
jgi:hypothetical protein